MLQAQSEQNSYHRIKSTIFFQVNRFRTKRFFSSKNFFNLFGFIAAIPFFITFAFILVVALLVFSNNSHSAALSSSYDASTINISQTPIQASQDDAQVFSKLVADVKYIRETTYPILRNSATFCKKQTIPFIGVFFTNQFDLDASIQSAAKKEYKLNEELRIIQLLPGFPAKLQGLLIGDILLSIDNKPFSYGKNSLPSAYNLLKQKLRPNRPSKITVRRGKHQVAFSVTPINICDFPPALSNSSQAYAHGNGRHIIISRGLLRSAKSKAQFATVVTHELAHNILRHPTFQQVSVNNNFQFELKSAVVGLNTISYSAEWHEPPYSQAFELEADYIGIKLMALSNFPIGETGIYLRKISTTDVPALWDRWQIKHPTTLNRFVALEQTINEVKQKKRDGDITFTEGADLDKLRQIRESRLASSKSNSGSGGLYSQHDEARVWAEKSFQGIQIKDWAQVIRTASTAIALDSNYTLPYINRSLAYINKGNFRRAIEDADSVLKIEPNNAMALNNRGFAYQSLQQLDIARESYKAACELKELAACQNFKEITGYRPEEIQFAVKKLLDRTYAEFSLKNWASVIKLSSKILNLQPNNIIALVNRAGAYAENGRLRESLRDCDSAIAIDPKYGLAYHNRGYVYELMEKYTQSMVEYKTSCDTGILASCTEYRRVSAFTKNN